jgi:hypothetical protein
LHGYIVDFYCYEAMLAVELDGAVHANRRTADGLRDDVLRANGIEVLRIPNDRVRAELPQVLSEIELAVSGRGTRGLYTPAVDAAWSLYRYGAEALGLTTSEPADAAPSTPAKRPAARPAKTPRVPKDQMATCTSCRLARASVDKTSGLCRSCTNRLSKRLGLSTKAASGCFVCRDCKREFVAPSAASVVCRRCRSSENVKPKCRSCERAVDAVTQPGWICSRCSDARAVALAAAGTGETPTGPLRDRQSRARRLRS